MTPTLLKVAILICIGAVLAGVVYFFLSQLPANSRVTPLEPYPQSQGDRVVVDLVQLNNSGESGTAVLEEKEGYVVVTLNVVGGKNGVTQPAHLHTDACPGLGAVKYSLKNVINGTSVTTLNLNLAQLKQELPLAINVHESTDNFKNYVVCGEVSLP